MRGMVSLATALGLPLLTAGGTPTPFRAEIILVTVIVIIITLVVQGLNLLPLYSRLRLPPDYGAMVEESHGRTEARRAALEYLADLRQEPWPTPEELARVESEIALTRQAGESSEETLTRAEVLRRVRLGVMRAKRGTLIRLRDEGAISDEVLLGLENELDYEALRLGAGLDR